MQIREEVDCIQAYMKIILIRYENKFSLSLDVEESLLVLQTPKMILQPIVENSVYHGLERMDQGEAFRLPGAWMSAGMCASVLWIPAEEWSLRIWLPFRPSLARSLRSLP